MEICTSGSYGPTPVYFAHLRLSIQSFTSELLWYSLNDLNVTLLESLKA